MVLTAKDLDNLDDTSTSPPSSGGGGSRSRNRKSKEVKVTQQVQVSNNEGEGDASTSNEVQEGGEGDGQTPVVQQPDNQPSALEKCMAILKSLLLRAMVVYFVMSFLRNKGTPVAQGPGGGAGPTAMVGGAASNAFPNGTEFILTFYLTMDEPLIKSENNNERRKLWQKRMTYGDWMESGDGYITLKTDFEVPVKQQNNGSLYLVAVMESLQELELKQTVTRQLNKFKRRKVNKLKNLLSSDTTEQEPKIEEKEEVIVSHYHPNITLNVVTDWTPWTLGSVPVPLNEYVQFLDEGKRYMPILYWNDYWNLGREWAEVGEQNKTLPLRVTIHPISLFKFQLYAAQSLRSSNPLFQLGETETEPEDQDSLKEAMLDTNPILLGLTFAVSLLHTVFEFLAFKNDIQFWNNRQSLEGLSVRSVFFNVFQSLIVLLYVLDNETNFVIKMSCGVGLIIELWKITKVTDVQVDYTSSVVPRIKFTEKSTYSESSTSDYDRMAFKYLGMLCFPLFAAYAVYSLIYNEHKSLYSFTLSISYGFLLTFGFIMMTPQLFINYKMKSVAHLPWRMLTYKFLNTFIDDIFAFVIKMPMMYRIGCLRDDVIFFIYLYQRWAYRTDYTRVNEFGWSQSQEQERQKNQIQENGKDKVAIASNNDKDKTE